MAGIITEERNGITYRYVNAQDGMRVYLLPMVPIDAGQIPVQEDLNDSKISEYMEELQFTSEQKERARRILLNNRQEL